jgi:predicted N-acyltransferase
MGTLKTLADAITVALEERRRLRSRSAFQIAIADRFAQLNAEHWRSVTHRGSFFHSAEYQRGFERMRPPNIEPRYALISEGDRPVATVCMQIARMDLTHVGRSGRKRVLAKLRRQLEQRVLVCGNLMAYGLHGVCIAEGADRPAVWQAVAEVLYRVRRAEKLAGTTDVVLVKDLDAAAMAESSVLKKLSYGAVPTEPNMVLQVDAAWRSHEDYLNSLVSKSRSDIKRLFRKFADAGCAVERLVDVATHQDTLQALYLQVHGNARFRPFTLPASYWPALGAAGGENVVMHVARRDERIIGFVLTLKDGETAFAYHIGFDRAAAEGGIPVYLRLLHASLEQAIAFGCRRVAFGRTALEPKARMGCIPEPTYIWARHRHPMLNQLVQPLLRLVEAEQAPAITPFREGATK